MTLAARSPAVLLMGPTASGKTGVALTLAQHIPLEIISVDSALIYRGMDIGTAKPSTAELAQVPHHLINILDPSQSYSAARFCQDALRLIDEIQGRGKLPLLVGGTMLYFKALREGLDTLPPADPQIRARLDAQALAQGWPALHARLAEVDAVTAARLPPNDAQRIQRALEIFEITGQPMSTLFQQRTMPEDRPRFLPIALEPSDRSQLHARITQRFDAMLAANFLDEVKRLRARGDLHPGLPSIRCVGYRQAWEYLDGILNAEEMREHAIIATRQLAKRQLTWLRSMEDRQSVDCLQKDLVGRVRQLIQPH